MSRYIPSAYPFAHHSVPDFWRHWLTDKQSLTHKLRHHCQGVFSVKLISSKYGQPMLSEAMALAIAPRSKVLIRQVELHCANLPIVVARSIIPVNALYGPLAAISNLGQRPLGELLYSHPRPERQVIGYVRPEIATKWLPTSQQLQWGRRALFYYNSCQKVLVTEIFTDQLPQAVATNC